MGLYLGKQSIIAINEKVATKQWVTDQHYLTDSNLADYVKNGELDTKVSEAGYVKTDALTTTLTSYATKTYVTEQIGSINSILENI